MDPRKTKMVVEKRMLKIKWTNRIRNDEVFQREKEGRLFKNLKNGHHKGEEVLCYEHTTMDSLET